MKPQDLLQVLQKVQVDSTYRQAIMEVLVPAPGMSFWAPPGGHVRHGPFSGQGCRFRVAGAGPVLVGRRRLAPLLWTVPLARPP